MQYEDETGDAAGEVAESACPPEYAPPADSSLIVRWAGPAFIVFSLALIPWSIYLGLSLPSRQLSHHYNVAWAGFDVLLLAALGSTGYFALRHSRYLAVTSAAAAALLVMDAWFDIMTSPRRQVPEAIILAAFVELPLGGICAWLSYHTENFAANRIVLRLRGGTSRR